MVREGLIYNDTVYMIFISFGIGLVIVNSFDKDIPCYVLDCYVLERLSVYLQTRL